MDGAWDGTVSCSIRLLSGLIVLYDNEAIIDWLAYLISIDIPREERPYGVSLRVSYLFGSRRPFLADPIHQHPPIHPPPHGPSLIPFFPGIMIIYDAAALLGRAAPPIPTPNYYRLPEAHHGVRPVTDLQIIPSPTPIVAVDHHSLYRSALSLSLFFFLTRPSRARLTHPQLPPCGFRAGWPLAASLSVWPRPLPP
jgi:hypothetical protein